MAAISAADARNHFAELIGRVTHAKDRVIISKNGKEVVALIPIEDLELLARLEDARDIADARRSLAEAKEKGTTSWADLKAELDL